jgi:hypothetical protein
MGAQKQSSQILNRFQTMIIGEDSAKRKTHAFVDNLESSQRTQSSLFERDIPSGSQALR